MAKTKQTEQKVPVSERALYQRIDRKLRADRQQMLKTSRSERMEQDMGRYYVIDMYRNVTVWHHVNLVSFARELGVIQPWEELHA
jgi:hypothetical protein